MSALTVDAATERRFELEHPTDHAAWWDWLAGTLGADPSKQSITKVTLGEGVLVVERHEQPLRVVGDEVATLEEVLPAPTPPPCWPT